MCHNTGRRQEMSETRWFIDRLNADHEEGMAGECLEALHSSMSLSCELKWVSFTGSMEVGRRGLHWRIAGETLENYKVTAPTSPHVVWEGFKKKIKKRKCFHQKNNLQHIQLSDTTGTSNGTGFYGQMKLNNELFSSKHSRWVWWTQG